MHNHGQFIAGTWREVGYSPDLINVLNKYTEERIGRLVVASAEEVDAAVAAADRAAATVEPSPRERHQALSRASDLLRERAEDFASLLVQEVGKTIREARAEVANAVEALLNAAEEAKRICGEIVPINANVGVGGSFAFTMRVPAGPVCAITPFNSPLNIVAHKVGSAIAAGNPVVVKPSELAPLNTAWFASLMAEAGLPSGYLSVVFGGPNVAIQLCRDARFARYSFTGGRRAGLQIAGAIGLRPATMELGPAGPTFVHFDADLDSAVRRVAVAAFGIAGQVCTSVQRLYVHAAVHDQFVKALLSVVGAMRLGDPRLEETDVGPVVSHEAAQRALQWVQEAVAAGASVLIGGHRKGKLVEPTVLANTTPDMRVQCQEAFAPLLSVIPYDDLITSVKQDNLISRGGLQAGIFTSDIATAFAFARHARAGGVMVNDTSRFRAPNMPFGGVGNAGHGKEGPAYAIRELTDTRTVVLHM